MFKAFENDYEEISFRPHEGDPSSLQWQRGFIPQKEQRIRPHEGDPSSLRF